MVSAIDHRGSDAKIISATDDEIIKIVLKRHNPTEYIEKYGKLPPSII